MTDAQPTPAELIQRQLDAYNARDIEAFMTCWSPDAELFEHPLKLLARGAAQIRQRHLDRFKEPNLQARLVNRLSAGTTVVDPEVMTSNFPEGVGQVDVIAIYDVRESKIARVWFIFGEPLLLATGASR
jgi:putative hydrolase of HD superfamily